MEDPHRAPMRKHSDYVLDYPVPCNVFSSPQHICDVWVNQDENEVRWVWNPKVPASRTEKPRFRAKRKEYWNYGFFPQPLPIYYVIYSNISKNVKAHASLGTVPGYVCLQFLHCQQRNGCAFQDKEFYMIILPQFKQETQRHIG